MAQRGRKSAAELSTPLKVISVDYQRLKPPPYLSDAAKKVFGEVVSASDPRAFRKAELPLLCAFCEAVCLNRYYGRALAEESAEDFIVSHRAWVESTKLIATLATRLRLTPHSRLDARGAGRLRTTTKLLPWEFSGDE